MATTNADIGTNWSLVAATGTWSLVTYASQRMALGNPELGETMVEFSITSPASGVVGHILGAGQALTPVAIGDGDLYARVSPHSSGAAQKLVVS